MLRGLSGARRAGGDRAALAAGACNRSVRRSQAGACSARGRSVQPERAVLAAGVRGAREPQLLSERVGWDAVSVAKGCMPYFLVELQLLDGSDARSGSRLEHGRAL